MLCLSVNHNQYIKNIQEQKPNKNILIHCYMGSSRSATILTAYLLKNFNLDPKLPEGWNLLKSFCPNFFCFIVAIAIASPIAN